MAVLTIRHAVLSKVLRDDYDFIDCSNYCFYGLLVMTFSRDHVANSPLWLWMISFESGNEVNVIDGLSSCLIDINSNVKSIWVQRLDQLVFLQLKEAIAIKNFVFAQRE